VVGEALAFFESERSVQHAWVVMPNHVHCLFTVLGAWKLDQLLHSWKSFTVNKINALLRRTGILWQRDYFDRMIRDGGHFMNCIRYIRNNPTKAGLRGGGYLIFESAWVKEMVPREHSKD
jgi:putative transposase